MPAGQQIPVTSKERGCVDREEQRHGGLINCDALHDLRVFEVADGVADFEAIHSCDCTEISASHVVHLFFAQTLKNKQFLGPCLAIPVFGAQRIILVRMKVAPEQTPNRNTTGVL